MPKNRQEDQIESSIFISMKGNTETMTELKGKIDELLSSYAVCLKKVRIVRDPIAWVEVRSGVASVEANFPLEYMLADFDCDEPGQLFNGESCEAGTYTCSPKKKVPTLTDDPEVVYLEVE